MPRFPDREGALILFRPNSSTNELLLRWEASRSPPAVIVNNMQNKTVDQSSDSAFEGSTVYQISSGKNNGPKALVYQTTRIRAGTRQEFPWTIVVLHPLQIRADTGSNRLSSSDRIHLPRPRPECCIISYQISMLTNSRLQLENYAWYCVHTG